MKPGKRIGEGNTAEVYEWGDTHIIKLFRASFPKEGAIKEYNIALLLNFCDIPIAKAVEFREIDGRTGIVYERITGKSMIEELLESREYRACGRMLGELHRRVHRAKSPGGLKNFKEILLKEILNNRDLDLSQKDRILNVLKTLPDGDRLCHGDFHPGNVLIQNKAPIILDWMTACEGEASADVARTSLILKYTVVPEYFPQRNVLQEALPQVFESYVAACGIKKEDMDRWMLPVAAARLNEWISDDEKKALLELILNHL